jgi:hypothetical protein
VSGGSAGSLSDLKTFVLSVHPSPAASLAEFSATPLVGTAPLLVRFSDSSANSPIAWSWLFGDGGTENEQNPSHLYTAPGTYAVSLTAVGAGGFEEVTKPAYITVLACTNPAVRLASSLASFADINTAYAAAMAGDVIQLNAVEKGGDILMDRLRQGEHRVRPYAITTVVQGGILSSPRNPRYPFPAGDMCQCGVRLRAACWIFNGYASICRS